MHETPLSTIGYEGHSIDSYFGKLIQAGATPLCDVRKNPISKKQGFSKADLTKYCAALGMKYFHFPELGIESEKRAHLPVQTAYNSLFMEYERYILPRQTASLRRLGDLIEKSNETIALTCFEHLPALCHRYCTANALARLLRLSNVRHL